MTRPSELCDNITDFKGFQPAADNLSREIRTHVEKEFTPEYRAFLRNYLTSDVVEYCRRMAGESGIDSREISDKPFFVSDEDIGINGAMGNSFALVRPGKKGAPFRVSLGHTDAPCPVVVGPWVVADAEKTCYSSNVYLDVRAKGGINPASWDGHPVKIMGYRFMDGKKKRIEMPGQIERRSGHIYHEGKIGIEELKVMVSARTISELERQLGVTNMDQIRSKLLLEVYPAHETWWQVDNNVSSYRQDDGSGIFASVKAFSEAKTDNTLIVFGLDREETGSKGGSAAFHGLVETVFEETRILSGYKAPLIGGLHRHLLGDLPALVVDVDIGFSGWELEETPEETDFRHAATRGFGATICTREGQWSGALVSLKHLEKITRILETNLPGRNKKDRFQTVVGYDSADAEATSATLATPLANYFPVLNVGIPLVSSHSIEESCNIFDLLALKQLIITYFQAK